MTRESFSELFESMHPPLLRYAIRFGASRQEADDILQEVFLRVWRDRREIEIRVSMSAMLYTMVRNSALNVKRDRKKIAADYELGGTTYDSVLADVGAEMDAQRLQRILRTWINDLPTRRGEAFILSRFHDLSHAEIAGIMGLSKRTVDTHILLALRELRARLDALKNSEMEP